MTRLFFIVFLVGCTRIPFISKDPTCVDGFLISTKEFGQGFCETVHCNGNMCDADGCYGFADVLYSPTKMILNGNVNYQATKCVNIENM